MHIQLTATRLDLTPALREYVSSKLKPLAKFLGRYETSGELTLFVEVARATKHHRRGEVFYAEVTLALPGEPTIRIEEYDADIRAAIDRVKDRLRMELSRRKDRSASRTKKARRKVTR
jgi:ribosomal subunit interface protein